MLQLTEKQKQVIKESIEVFGLPTQFILIREEASELIQAICKAQRFQDRRTLQGLTEELIDLQIMIYTLTSDKPLPNQVKQIQDNFTALIYELSYLIGQSILFELAEKVKDTAYASDKVRVHKDYFLECCQNLDLFIENYKGQNKDLGLGFDEILEAKLKRLETRIKNVKLNRESNKRTQEQKAMLEAINGKN